MRVGNIGASFFTPCLAAALAADDLDGGFWLIQLDPQHLVRFTDCDLAHLGSIIEHPESNGELLIFIGIFTLPVEDVEKEVV